MSTPRLFLTWLAVWCAILGAAVVALIVYSEGAEEIARRVGG